MSITPPVGILDITNAIVRVSKLEFRGATGFDTILNNVARNTILLVDQNVEYTTDKPWGLKLPNAWVSEFDAYWASGASGNIDFNIYNNTTSGTNGYVISMDDTTITVKYDGGSALETVTLGSTLKNDTWRKIHILFERDMISLALDGTPVLYFKDTLLRPRVYDEESGYVIASGLSADRKVKNLKVVNGDKWITDGTSNIAYTHGNVGIGTTRAAHTLDVHGDIRATGNLLIEGLTTTVDTQNLSIEDAIVEIGRGNDGGTSGKDVGFLFTRNNGANTTNSNVALIYDESTDRLTLGYSDGSPTASTLAINTSKSLDVVIPSGNLGVGTDSPVDLFHVANGTIRCSDAGNTINIPGLKVRRRAAAVGQTGSNYIECGQFNDVGNDGSGTDGNKFIVTNTGNVGIGTTIPGQKLSIYTGSTATSALSFDRYSTGNYRTDIYQNTYGPDFRVGYDGYTPESILYLKRFSDGRKEVEINGDVGIDGDIFTKDWGNRSADGSTTNLYIGRFSRNRPVNIEINTSGTSIGSTSTFEVLRHYNAHPVVSANVGEAFARYQWYYQSVDTSNYDLWVRPIHANSGNYNIRALSSGYQVVTEPGSPTLVSCVYGVITCGKYNENSLTGIGTASPGAPLAVASTRNADTWAADKSQFDVLNNNGSGSFYGMSFAVSQTRGDGIIQTFNRTAGTANYNLCLQPNSGNVGIGTTNPRNKLHIYKATTDQLSGLFIEKPNGASGTAQVTFGVNDPSENPGVAKAGIFFERRSVNGRGDLKFCVDNADDANNVGVADTRMTITRTGDVGIGTASPIRKFDVRSGFGNSSAGWISGAFGGTGNYPRVVMGALNSVACIGAHNYDLGAWEKLYLNDPTHNVVVNVGNVGIGVASPSYPLHVAGNAGNMPAMKYFNSSSTTLASGVNDSITIYAAGNIYASGLIAASDERIKKNIVDADDAECLETLRLLKPKKYQYKDEINRGQEPVWGFIAQEVRDTLQYATHLGTNALPNMYEVANVSQSNVITFVNFNTSNLEANAITIHVKTIHDKEERVTLAEVVDEHTIRVEEDLSKWTGSLDAEGNVITEITTTTLTPEEYEALEDKTGCVANISGYQNANVVISVEEYNGLEDTTGYEEVIENYTKTTTIYPGTQLFVYGQEVDDFVYIKKEAIWTVATSALQEVDRQLQAEKAKVATLETQLASVLARLDALENA